MGLQDSNDNAMSDKRARAMGADEEERFKNSKQSRRWTVIQIFLSSMAGP